MRYLALDCATVKVGWAVVDANGVEMTRADSGVWDISKRAKDFPDRLLKLDAFLSLLIKTFSPERLVVETAFMGANAQSTLRIAEVRGVALLHAGRGALNVRQVAPASLKKLVGGHGRADKEAVAAGVRRFYPDENLVFATDDESDAMALAIYGILKDNE